MVRFILRKINSTSEFLIVLNSGISPRSIFSFFRTVAQARVRLFRFFERWNRFEIILPLFLYTSIAIQLKQVHDHNLPWTCFLFDFFQHS